MRATWLLCLPSFGTVNYTVSVPLTYFFLFLSCPGSQGRVWGCCETTVSLHLAELCCFTPKQGITQSRHKNYPPGLSRTSIIKKTQQPRLTAKQKCPVKATIAKQFKQEKERYFKVAGYHHHPVDLSPSGDFIACPKKHNTLPVKLDLQSPASRWWHAKSFSWSPSWPQNGEVLRCFNDS